jgi:cytochrome c553
MTSILNSKVIAGFAASILAGSSLVAHAAAPLDVEAAKTLAQPCQACHGADGNSTAAIYPRIAGQYPDYLARAMREYRDGGRVNPIMSVYVEKLSNEDIRILANYYGTMPGKLDDLHAHMKGD